MIEIVVSGPLDEEKGWVVDFADIDSVVEPLVKRLDHQLLNEIDGLSNPTSELLGRWIWAQLSKSLPLLAQVRVRETKNSMCVVELV